METLDIRSLSQIQVDAFLECIDLVRNGYIQRFAVFDTKFWFIKYKHLVNGREIIVRWKPDCYSLSEGKKILKEVRADS